ncbi:MAG: 2-phosphosulfolactate phosphatase [Gemmatimonadetes bacterium]|nr:2-phosphosulfolactate phosphatase [Gemmatimonadota bacterium]
MRADVYLTVAEAEQAGIGPQVTAVVIDVLRATSTMVAALAAGAKAIYPAVSSEDALKLAQSLGRDDTLLCGERRGLKVEGYDLGNSPREFTPAVVGGKRLVMSTTNGTRAFQVAQAAQRVLVASFLNLGAAAEALGGSTAVAILCAGRLDLFSLEDAVCAGTLLRRVEQITGQGVETNDAGRAALALASATRVTPSFLAETDAGRALAEIGLEDDLELCAQVDRHGIVPEMYERMIRVTDGAGD